MGTALTVPLNIEYPENDGEPMSDNSLQFDWIQLLSNNLLALFQDDGNVFVGGNLLWYPVVNEPKVRMAPDTLVVFGRGKHYRGSYLQWLENDIPLTVVFEVRSPSDTDRRMQQKLRFYQKHGVEEYYLIDPDHHTLNAYRRSGTRLREQDIVPGQRFTSPRLGIHFVVGDESVCLFYPDGRLFVPFDELSGLHDQAVTRAEDAERQVQKLAARNRRLAELSRKARRGEATPAEITELERLEAEGG